ncbi:hypothetical protein A1O3_07335 [Capronia epimyces CBS 606.96]|uniref:NmrA-like domain-containing protein n=1 Tax=Capronia epimyces CBS 606.96 TaxID=1182542 RepID=W9XKJ4_9EURO|nr:uncharacterized protein A1O3_07335 [Capronia epimyces CBS 606.96]EXJ81047.1 hypothetical protein A1O3_07335 [Capronia epimyces CBS 606.96]
MSSQHRTILVTGATGTQGGHVIRELLSASKSIGSGFTVTIHAFVRDQASQASQALLALDPQTVKLFQGDFEDSDSLSRAAESCTSTFLNVTPSFTDPEAERRHARNILTASLSAGVKHIILASVTAAHEYKTFNNLPLDSWMGQYWVSKASIIDLVKDPPVPRPEGYTYTILQPAGFLTNFLPPGQRIMYPNLSAAEPSIQTALNPSLRLSYLDPADIGRFVAHITFSSPADLARLKFANEIVPIASVHLTMSEIADLLSEAVGRRKVVRVDHLSPEEAEAAKDNPFYNAQIFQNQNPTTVDLDKVRAYGIALGGVKEFFERERERVEEALGL